MKRSSTQGRYKEPHKEKVPKMRSSEIVERLNKFPLSKNELVDYLVRLQQSKDRVDREAYNRLMKQPKFKEIIEEVQI